MYQEKLSNKGYRSQNATHDRALLRLCLETSLNAHTSVSFHRACYLMMCPFSQTKTWFLFTTMVSSHFRQSSKERPPMPNLNFGGPSFLFGFLSGKCAVPVTIVTSPSKRLLMRKAASLLQALCTSQHSSRMILIAQWRVGPLFFSFR